MKYQLLLVMALFSVVLTSHMKRMPKRRNSNARRLSVNDKMVTSRLKVNIVKVGATSPDPQIELGHVIDVTKFDDQYFQPGCIDAAKFKALMTEERVQHSDSFNKVVNGDEQSLLNLSGSLELNVPLEVAAINGKAQMKFENNKNKSSKNSVVRQVIELYNQSVELGSVKGDFLSSTGNCVKYTHVVTRLIRGRRFEGLLTMTDTTNNQQFSANGSLEVKLASIPVGGKGELNMDWLSKTAEYNFKAEIRTDGGKAIAAVSKVEDFFTYSKCWFESANTTRRLRSTPRKSLKRRLQETKKPLPIKDITAGAVDCPMVQNNEGLFKDHKTMTGDDTAVLAYELTPIVNFQEFKSHAYDINNLDEISIQNAKVAHNQLQEAKAAQQALSVKLDCAQDEKSVDYQDEIKKKVDLIDDARKNLDTAVATGKPDTKTIDAARQNRLARFMFSPLFKNSKTKIEGCTRRRRLNDQIRILKRRLRNNKL